MRGDEADATAQNPAPTEEVKDMQAAELGEKRACAACAARFYDLRRQPAVCPICQAVQPPEKPRAARGAAVARVAWGRGGPRPARVEVEVAEADQEAAGDEDDTDEDADDENEAEDGDDEVTPARVAE
jgi:uncharacterized protein (TIGR02300 family)